MAEPKVRFKKANGESYPEWVEYTVADVFDKVKDKNKNLENTNVITNSAEFGLVNQREFFDKDIAVEGKTNNYTIIKNGDFVYNPRKSSYAPMGPFNCYGLEDDGIVSPLYTCLRPKGVLDSNFLLWYFKTDKWHGYVNEHGAQNGVRHDRVGMTDAIMMGIPITAPCDEEQQKIANALDQVDSLISKAEQEVEKLQELKRGCLQKMFPRDGASVPEVRFPEFTGDWEQRKFGDVGTVSMCKRIFKDETTPEGDIPFFKIGTFGSEPDAYISRKLFEEYKSKFSYPEDGAILLSASGTIGRIVEYNGEEAYFQDSNIVWLSHDNSVTNKFLKVVYPTVKWDGIEGSTIQRLYNDNFLKTKFMMPSIPEQEKLAEFFEELDNLITLHQRECEKYKELKKGLLQQMFV